MKTTGIIDTPQDKLRKIETLIKAQCMQCPEWFAVKPDCDNCLLKKIRDII